MLEYIVYVDKYTCIFVLLVIVIFINDFVHIRKIFSDIFWPIYLRRLIPVEATCGANTVMN